MYYRSTVATGLLSLLLLVTTMGCASGPDTNGDDEDFDRPPGMDAAEAYEASAPWLSAQSMVVISAAGPTLWETLGDEILPTASADAEPGTPGTAQALRADLEELIELTFGFDIGRTEAVAIGAHMEGGTAVLFGDFEISNDFPTFDIDGQTGFQLTMSQMEGQSIPFGGQAFLLPIEEPQSGLVIASSRNELEELVAAFDQDGSGASLASVEQGAEYSQLFGRYEEATLAVAVPSSGMQMIASANNSMPVPDSAVLHYDYYRGYSSMTIQGDEQTLTEIEAIVEDGKDMLRQSSEKANQRPDEQFIVELISLYSTHTVKSVVDQLEPTRESGRLAYDMHFTTEGILGLWAFGFVGGMGAFLFAAVDEPSHQHHGIEAVPVTPDVEEPAPDAPPESDAVEVEKSFEESEEK